MAGVTNREFWDFRVKTRAQFTKLAEQIANIDTSGGGGISELTSKMVVDALGYTPYNANNPANYITASALTPYLKTEDAEGTYATKDFVNNKLVNYAPLTSVQGFENRIGGLEGAVPQLNKRVTTVEGKVSSLNETVSTGENNLLDRVNVIEQEYATKTYVDSVEQLAATKLDSSYFTLANIKSTLGISDWALAATKPSYTASEVGALGVNETAASSLKMTPEYLTDLNNATPWRFFDMKSGYGSTDGNKPNTAWISGITGTVAGSSVYRWQLAHTLGNPRPYFRSETAGAWSDWLTLALTSDIPTKLSQFTDDVVAGKYLPITGGTINTAATTPLNIKNTQSNPTEIGISFMYNNDLKGWIGYTTQNGIYLYTYNGYHRLGIKDDGTAYVDSNTLIHSGNIKDQYVAGVYDSYNPLMKITFNYAGGGVTSNPVWLACWNGYALTYVSPDNVKAGSATKLATRHKLWGNDFDGTEDVSGSLDVSGNIKASGNINATSITINGVTITASNGTITVNGNVFAKGDITGGV